MCLMQSYILSSHQVSTAVFQYKYKHCVSKVILDPSGHMQFILGKDSAIEMRSSNSTQPSLSKHCFFVSIKYDACQ